VPATFAVSDDGIYLIETFTGDQTAEMFRATADELLKQMRQTGLVKVLVDSRAQQAPLPTIDAYNLWNELAPRMPRRTRMAVLVTWPLLGYTFGETVAVNRGVNVRNFNDYDAAVAWLRSTGGPP